MRQLHYRNAHPAFNDSTCGIVCEKSGNGPEVLWVYQPSLAPGDSKLQLPRYELSRRAVRKSANNLCLHP